MFGGTRDKCVGCKNTVYPTEKVINSFRFSQYIQIHEHHKYIILENVISF